MASPPPIKTLSNVSYATASPYQTYDITILDPSPSKLWIIYIHGGAWRDPAILSDSFTATQSQLLSSPYRDQIAGLASVSYRLSPHPDYPPDTPLPERVAVHPQHRDDVVAALRALQSAHGLERYVLVGHSCGATLAFQSLSCLDEGLRPLAVCAVAGINDLPLLVEVNPGYRGFVSGAFGEEEREWREASPVSMRIGETEWREGRLVLLAHSRTDGLVGWEQVDAMVTRLEECGWNEEGERRYAVLEIHGEHDEAWREGTEAARAIETCIQRMLTLKSER